MRWKGFPGKGAMCAWGRVCGGSRKTASTWKTAPSSPRKRRCGRPGCAANPSRESEAYRFPRTGGGGVSGPSQVPGQAPLPCRYRDPGSMVILGRNAAVAHLRGRDYTGFPAWIVWLAVHIFQLIGFRHRLVVMINWAWDYFLYERAVRIILPESRPGEGIPADEASQPAADNGKKAHGGRWEAPGLGDGGGQAAF